MQNCSSWFLENACLVHKIHNFNWNCNLQTSLGCLLVFLSLVLNLIVHSKALKVFACDVGSKYSFYMTTAFLPEYLISSLVFPTNLKLTRCVLWMFHLSLIIFPRPKDFEVVSWYVQRICDNRYLLCICLTQFHKWTFFSAGVKDVTRFRVNLMNNYDQEIYHLQ